MTTQQVYDIIFNYIKDNIEYDEGFGVSEIETDEGMLKLDLYVKVEVGCSTTYRNYYSPPEDFLWIENFDLDLNSDVVLVEYDDDDEEKVLQTFDIDECKLHDDVYDYCNDDLIYMS